MSPIIRRRILLCASGMSPQIVTETLYALALRSKNAWVPDEVHLISTRAGAEQARLNLLSDSPGWFYKLLRDYNLPAIYFTPSTIHCIQNENGEDLDDIRTPSDNEAAANSIAELVRRLTEDEQTELHVSLAGGRKTMGYYLGYALSIYGRPQDRLSHILINGAFEGHPGFYYPTPYQWIIQTRDSKPQALDCSKAVIEFAEIPFVRLRDGLPQRLLIGKANFMETVEIANLAHGEVHLYIDTASHSVRVNGISVKLAGTYFALLYWFAERTLNNNPEIHWDQYGEWHDNYLPLLRRLFRKNDNNVERAENALKFAVNDPQSAKNYFQPTLSKLRKILNKELSKALADRCAIQKTGRKKAGGYRLPSDLKITIQ